ncbi:MAG TPA: hypothetical protein VN541_08655, partial [Tepidisphaeraceae bacterium]|nr:hypothetical protein [Tepidisphaeraceae bacterium]
MPDLMQVIPPPTQGRTALLERVFALLDRERVRWCWVHGSAAGGENVSDVDLVVEKAVVSESLANLLIRGRDELQADVALWLDDRAQYIVLVGTDACARPCVLPLHVSTEYELGGRRFYTGEQVLQSRRRNRQIWVPAPDIE